MPKAKGAGIGILSPRRRHVDASLVIMQYPGVPKEPLTPITSRLARPILIKCIISQYIQQFISWVSLQFNKQ